ncbi:MAG: hypothetical protein ACJA0V_002355, partial [Planctomycetota bacterium]
LVTGGTELLTNDVVDALFDVFSLRHFLASKFGCAAATTNELRRHGPIRPLPSIATG